MPFGYIPNENPLKDLILKLTGYPNWIRRIQQPILMRMLSLEEEDIVLDIGCRPGFFAYEIAKKSGLSVGIDLDLNMEYPVWGEILNYHYVVQKQENLYLVIGDGQILPFKPKSFDKILASSVLQTVEDDKMFLANCHNILKDGGSLILSVSSSYLWLKRLNDLKPELKKWFGCAGKGYYENEEITKLLSEAGFKIIESEYGPKKWGSLIFETLIFLSYLYGFPHASPFLFPLVYPLAFIDNFAGKRQRGCDLIIRAIKL